MVKEMDNKFVTAEDILNGKYKEKESISVLKEKMDKAISAYENALCASMTIKLGYGIGSEVTMLIRGKECQMKVSSFRRGSDGDWHFYGVPVSGINTSREFIIDTLK